jgi:hypothetical protein
MSEKAFRGKNNLFSFTFPVPSGKILDQEVETR